MNTKRLVRSAAVVCLTAMYLLIFISCAGSSGSVRQIARIGQTVITEGELDTYSALKMYSEGFDPSGTEAELKKQCLEEMVDSEVIRQYYEANGTEIYDDVYNSGKDSFLETMQSNEGEFLQQNEITHDDLVYYYRAQYVTGKFFEETKAQHSVEEIDSEAKEYYEKNQAEYVVEKEKRLSVILTKKKKQAVEVIERLNNGEDFADVAREVSIDANSAVNGGDLGFFKKQDTLQRFGKGVFNLEIGEFTESPVKTNDGFSVIKVTDSHDSGFLSYEEVSQDIMYSLYENYNKERIQEIKKSMDIKLL